MNAMKLADAESRGAVEISAFHQLSGGNSGSGTDNGPPSVLVANSHVDVMTAVNRTTSTRTATFIGRGIRNDQATRARCRKRDFHPPVSKNRILRSTRHAVLESRGTRFVLRFARQRWLSAQGLSETVQ